MSLTRHLRRELVLGRHGPFAQAPTIPYTVPGDHAAHEARAIQSSSSPLGPIPSERSRGMDSRGKWVLKSQP